MKFKEQSFTLFAYTNYMAIQDSHRLEPLDFKGKGAFRLAAVLNIFWGKQYIDGHCLIMPRFDISLSGSFVFEKEQREL